MPRNMRLRELLIGVEGLALLRHLYDGSDAEADRRLAEVRRALDDEAFAAQEAVSEADSVTGYRAWSERYDEPGNLIIALEEPAMRSLIDAAPPGRALDAACGTGRHARYLADRGHRVVGVDSSPEMLARARSRVPEATLIEADLQHLPAADAAFDLAVSGLALAHLADLTAGVRELARVVRPGGRLVLSVLHPFQVLLGWHAPFEDASGHRRFVREHPHTHGDYLAAFVAAGLAVRRCVEPPLGADHVRGKRRAFRHVPEATLAAYAGLPGVLIWDVERL